MYEYVKEEYDDLAMAEYTLVYEGYDDSDK